VNAIVGILGMMGTREIAGIPMNAGTVGMVVNLASRLGHSRGITAKKAAHA
jgi:hypothetical protein